MSTDRLKEGVLLRRKDGTLYFISDSVLEQYRLPDDYQAGGQEQGSQLQTAMDRMPPVFGMKNALHLGKRDLAEIIDASGSDISGGIFRPRVVASKASALANAFDEASSYSTFIGRSKSDAGSGE